MNEVMMKEPSAVHKRQASLLELDMDANAGRYSVLNRHTFALFHSGIRPPSGVLKVLLPLEHSVAPTLLVGILDDSGEYNAKFADGVQLQVVNAHEVDMSQ